jgi:hypothetical protein
MPTRFCRYEGDGWPDPRRNTQHITSTCRRCTCFTGIWLLFAPLVFWHGAAVSGATTQDPSRTLEIGPWYLDRRAEQARALPKTLLVSSAIGVWLMFTRVIFGTEGAMANSDHLSLLVKNG